MVNMEISNLVCHTELAQLRNYLQFMHFYGPVSSKSVSFNTLMQYAFGLHINNFYRCQHWFLNLTIQAGLIKYRRIYAENGLTCTLTIFAAANHIIVIGLESLHTCNHHDGA